MFVCIFLFMGSQRCPGQIYGYIAKRFCILVEFRPVEPSTRFNTSAVNRVIFINHLLYDSPHQGGYVFTCLLVGWSTGWNLETVGTRPRKNRRMLMVTITNMICYNSVWSLKKNIVSYKNNHLKGGKKKKSNQIWNVTKIVMATYFGGLFSSRLDQSQIQSAFLFIR